MSHLPPSEPNTTGHPEPEELSALVDGELEGARAAQVEAHLSVCAECRADSSALSDVRATVQGLPTPAPSRSASDAVALALSAVEEPEGKVLPLRRSNRQRHRPVGVAAAVAALVLLLGGGAIIADKAVNGVGTSESAPRALGGSAQTAKSSPGAPGGVPVGRAPVEFRLLLPSFSRASAIGLTKSDVQAISITRAAAGYDATVILRRGLQAGDFVKRSNQLSDVEGPTGTVLGKAHELSARAIEITGLSEQHADELRRLLA